MIMGNFARTWIVQEKEKAWWKRELVSGRGNVTVSTLVCSFGYPSLPYCSHMDRECFKMFWTDVILKKKKPQKNRKCRYVPPWRNLNDFFWVLPSEIVRSCTLWYGKHSARMLLVFLPGHFEKAKSWQLLGLWDTRVDSTTPVRYYVCSYGAEKLNRYSVHFPGKCVSGAKLKVDFASVIQKPDICGTPNTRSSWLFEIETRWILSVTQLIEIK